MNNNNKYAVLRAIGHQSWIRVGIRNRLIKLFCDHADAPHKEFEIDFQGYRYRGNLNCYIDWSAFFFGAYEKTELRLLSDIARRMKNPVFIDVGANIGHHSLYMSNYCTKVYSFEPLDTVRQKIEQKIRQNNLKNIQIHPVALGSENTELEFFAPKGSNSGTGSFVPLHEKNNNSSIGTLKVVNGDDYFAKTKIEKVDIVKIDVEGFEKSVLIGLKNTIKIHRPVLFIEYSEDTKASFKDYDEFKSLLPNGYKFYRVVSNQKLFGIFNNPKYTFSEFDMNKAGCNLLLIPYASLCSGQTKDDSCESPRCSIGTLKA